MTPVPLHKEKISSVDALLYEQVVIVQGLHVVHSQGKDGTHQ